MNVRYRVALSQAEREQLSEMLRGGHHAARKLKRAQILLAADSGATDTAIATSVAVGESTVYRTKRRFVLNNLEQALSEEPRPAPPRKLSGKEEALLIATACANPPQGRARWTLELLADEMVRLTDHSELSREHAETPDPRWPVVCFDESPVQLIGETRQPIPAAPGRPRRYDYEYRRNGTANLFVFLDAQRPWRKVKVTDQRTAQDFAECMRDLVDLHYPQADLVRVVLDNLSTHTAGALYEAVPAPEAHRILRRLEFHYTPRHASWLNMVEIEIGVLRGQCLNRRIGERKQLVSQIAAWEKQRNKARARIKWMFNVRRARTKLARAYPAPAKES